MLRKPAVPSTEYSPLFLQGMVNRMAVSYHKYGAVADAYSDKLSAIKCAKVRLKWYRETGNTEFLIDAANFFMIEFMRPSHPKAHFRQTSAVEAPPRVTKGGRKVYARNKEIE